MIGDRLDVLVGQIGVLTEVVTTGLAELKDGLSEMKKIAQAQQQDISRLVSVTDKQAQTVDRLSLMLERLLGDRGNTN